MTRTLRMRVVLASLVAVTAGGLAACQHNEVTDFPPGLTPLEPDAVPEQEGGTPTETLRTSVDDTGYIHIYGRGDVLAPPAQVWVAMQDPMADVAVCSTNDQMITPNNDPDYEFSFLVAYTVNNVVTVQWDDQWRFGVIDGTPDAPTEAIAKHQKIDGSSFISLSEGTVTLVSTDDPNVSELQFVEHLDSVGGTSADVLTGVQHNYDSIVSVTHGGGIPACP